MRNATNPPAVAEPPHERRPPSSAAHLLTVDEAFDAFGSSRDGLSSEEARSRLARFGPNQLEEREKSSAWKRLLLQFHNPLIYVLLVTAGATALLQHWIDTGVIVGVVIINAVIGFIQESKAEQAIESLKQMLAPQAIVIRDRMKGQPAGGRAGARRCRAPARRRQGAGGTCACAA